MSLSFANGPETGGCEDVALFRAAILCDEEKGLLTVRAGVVDLEWTGDKY